MIERRPAHLPYLDGLRAVAVLLVVFGHLPFVPGLSLWNAAWSVNQSIRGANIGVDLFFVLSGFLITRILLQERVATGGVSFRVFYIKRSLRIFPIYYLSILACALIFGLTRPEAGSLLFYAFNYYHPFNPQPHPLEHTWSLAVEEQFYLVWPFLIGWVPLRYGRLVTGIVIPVLAVVVALVLAATFESTLAADLIYKSAPTRMMSLSLGAFLAFSERRGSVLNFWAGLAAIGAGIMTLAVAAVGRKMGIVPAGGYYWCIVLVGSAAFSAGSIALLVLSPSVLLKPVRYVLSVAPLRYIGRISYGIYLYHLIILFALGINPAKVAGEGTTAPHLLLGIALSFGIAALSYQFIEAPLLRLKGRVRLPSNRMVRPLEEAMPLRQLP